MTYLLDMTVILMLKVLLLVPPLCALAMMVAQVHDEIAEGRRARRRGRP